MGLAVVTVASGGLPVVDVTAIAPRTGTPVTEATNGYGVPVTKVAALGMPVVFESIGVAAAFTAWDVATVANVTLSGNNLIATNTGTTSADQGARIAASKSAGKFYLEATRLSIPASGNYGIGIATIASSYTTFGNTAVTGNLIRIPAGTLWDDGSATGITIATFNQNDTVGIAVDIDNRRIWFRKSPAGVWNQSGTSNPATNTEGVPLRGTGAMIPVCVFGGTGGTSGNSISVNSGASVFSGAVPAGFTSGWPA